MTPVLDPLSNFDWPRHMQFCLIWFTDSKCARESAFHCLKTSNTCNHLHNNRVNHKFNDDLYTSLLMRWYDLT